jgi:hypothetical protein
LAGEGPIGALHAAASAGGEHTVVAERAEQSRAEQLGATA